MLQQLDMKSRRGVQGLILVPTRELATQVRRVVQSIGDYMDINCHAFVGGTSVAKDMSILREGRADIAVGTPGRIHDLMRRNILSTNCVRTVTLDEADDILSREFSYDVDAILSRIPPSAQIAIISATLPKEVIELTEKVLREPTKITVLPEELSLKGIRQYYVDVDKEENKLDTLIDLFNDISISQSVIFCNTNKRVAYLTSRLVEQGYPAACIHGQLSGEERTIIMERFRNGNIRVLICSDLLARGIDIQTVSVVLNYDIPQSRETYLHRIGRSGRFGRRGVAISFVTYRDVPIVRDLEKYYDTKLDELPKNIADFI